jgi:hypothetical protein
MNCPPPQRELSQNWKICFNAFPRFRRRRRENRSYSDNAHRAMLPSFVRCRPLSSRRRTGLPSLVRPGRRRAKAAREELTTYCLSAGGFASGVGTGASGSGAGVAPRSSGGAKQSPAQSLVPLTVPTSLQAIGAIGFACFSGLPLCLGAAV